MRVDMEPVVLAVNLFCAAFFQDTIPAMPHMPVKFCFLTAVALYVTLTRPAHYALPAALLAGAATDALGGIPQPCTFFYFLLAVGMTRFWKRTVPASRLPHGMLLTAFCSLFQGIWTYLWLGSAYSLSPGQWAARMGYLFLSGLVAGWAGFAWCGLIDRYSGLKKPMEEDNGAAWSETDR